MSGGSGTDPRYQRDPSSKGEKSQESKAASPKNRKSDTRWVNPLDVFRLLRQQLSLGQIAQKLGVKAKDIQKALQKAKQEARKLSARDYEIWKLYYLEKMLKTEIARKLNLANSTVARIFNRHGWKSLPRPNRANPEIAGSLYKKGLTQKEIAKKLGVSPTAIGAYLRKLGIKTRKRGFSSDQERRIANKEKSRRELEKVKALRDKLFGKTCRLCGAGRDKRTIAVHRKDCIPHDERKLWSAGALRKMNPDEYAALCVMCHRGVHWAHDRLGQPWNDLEKRAEQQKKDIKKRDEKSGPDEAGSAHSSGRPRTEYEGMSAEEIRNALFGKECYICGPLDEDKKPRIHRKDGQKHSDRLLRNKNELMKIDPDEWVPLCSKDHRYVHWAMRRLGITWEEIDSLLQAQKSKNQQSGL